MAAPARKDYKGLFGSYRREKFTENEANFSDIGLDVILSTMFPLSSMVASTEDRNAGPSAMPFSHFFNVEGNIFVTIDYNWEIFAGAAYLNWDTRRENTVFTQATEPTFQLAEVEAIPLTAGVKYRFSQDDIVPYVGIGAGMAFVKRQSGYDYAAQLDTVERRSAVALQVLAGFEFFFTSRAGLRLELSAYNLRLPSLLHDPSAPSGSATANPIMVHAANPWMLRYASGIFILF